MSGTSADGVDAALAELRGTGETLRVELLAHETYPFAPELRERILGVCRGDAPLAAVSELNFLLGRSFAEAALAVIAKAGYTPGEVDLIASHGQTVYHAPPRASEEMGHTLQIGEAAVICELTGLPVVADFRPRDLAAGGQGAPLVAYADWVLLRHPRLSRAVQNLGGIANVTYLPAGGGLDQVIAFDTGPGNMVIDALAAHFSGGRLHCDRDGQMAARGSPDPGLLSWMLDHPYFSQAPPRTAGREEFGTGFVRRLLVEAHRRGLAPETVVATAPALTAESIARSYEQFLRPRGPIDEVILGGGGTYNPTLRAMLQRRLPGIALLTHEDLGLDSKAKEALSFAILGHETMMGRPASVPSATGAHRAVVLGKLTLP